MATSKEPPQDGTFDFRTVAGVFQQAVSRAVEELGKEYGDPSPSDFGSGPLAAPPLDVLEDPTHIRVQMELPGVAVDDIEVTLEGDKLTIRGEKRLPGLPSDVRRHRSERYTGRFRRLVRLPTAVDPSGIEAAMAEGVLTITLPKISRQEGVKIPVKKASQ